jgi:polygalacturonase
MPGILRRIVPPMFPERNFDVTQYGAVGDGTTSCTAAFQAAMAACNKAGGGRVLVPKGKFFTGPIHFKSNVELHLAEGAEIIFSDKFSDYLPVVFVRVGGIEMNNYSPLIYAHNCTNIAVTGRGTLNGNAKAWWGWAKRETRQGFEMGAKGVPVEKRVFGTPEAAIRPSFLSFVSCTNVLLSDFTITSGPNWTIHPVYCVNTTVRHVNVQTDGPNNDGLDPDSCRDLLIEDCTFSTGDDCVVLKSGYNEDGWRVNRPTENVIMRRCSSHHGHGGLVVGSEMSGGVRNVFMEDCEFTGTDRAIRIKSRADRGGVVEDIFARNLKATNMQREAVILNMDYGSDPHQSVNIKPPVFRNMQFENISGSSVQASVTITGMESSPIENLRLVNLNITSASGVNAKNLKNVVFKNVQVTPAKGSVYDFSNAAGITIRGAVAPSGTEVFAKVSGQGSRDIRFEASDLSKAGRAYTLGAGVATNAVVVQ